MEDINGAIEFGVRLTHDERIGYTTQGLSLANGFETDCSDFIWWCLKNNGFNVPSSRWSTNDMITFLSNYEGFTRYNMSRDFQLQHGDILVYDNDGPGFGGHTFFYAENVIGYASSDSYNTQLLSRARVEASSSHGQDGGKDPQYAGDHRKDGTGAFYEVWTHSYSFDFEDGYIWYVFRWGGEPVPPHPTNYHKTKNWLYTRKDNNTKFIFQN